tara:strand:- start:532 stop:1500 length:969 start_codon:yes stop_codon:yes gene_type:complete
MKKPTFIIAEIGNNHEGNFVLAKKLVTLAAKAKVDAVKFQVFKTEKFIIDKIKKKFNKLKKFELSFNQFAKLKRLAHKYGLKFIVTPLDLQSMKFALKHADIIKIASGDNDFFYMIKKILISKKKIIISTGSSNFKQIVKILDVLKKYKANKRSSLLHCVSLYPVEDKFANLKSIKFLKENSNINIGYSDHTIGVEACLGAVALGAKIIEKHFTINKKYSSFRDHQLSSDYKEMKSLVESIRRLENMLGQNNKEINNIERKNNNLIRRSVYAGSKINKGDYFNEKNVSFLRPRKNASNLNSKKLIGLRSKKNIAKGSLIKTN